jgi:hypothetical protein
VVPRELRLYKPLLAAAAAVAVGLIAALTILGLAATGVEVRVAGFEIDVLEGPVKVSIEVCNRSPLPVGVEYVRVEIQSEGVPVAGGERVLRRGGGVGPGSCVEVGVPLRVYDYEGALKAALLGGDAVVEVEVSVGPLRAKSVDRVPVEPLVGGG